jgi:hypothetical protein
VGMDTSLSDVPSTPPTTGPNSVMNEDEDLWNIIDEIQTKKATWNRVKWLLKNRHTVK